MSELTSDDDEETVNLASATIIFSGCALLCGFKPKATCSLVKTGLTPLVFVDTSVCPFVYPFRWSSTQCAVYAAVRRSADRRRRSSETSPDDHKLPDSGRHQQLGPSRVVRGHHLHSGRRRRLRRRLRRMLWSAQGTTVTALRCQLLYPTSSIVTDIT